MTVRSTQEEDAPAQDPHNPMDADYGGDDEDVCSVHSEETEEQIPTGVIPEEDAQRASNILHGASIFIGTNQFKELQDDARWYLRKLSPASERLLREIAWRSVNATTYAVKNLKKKMNN